MNSARLAVDIGGTFTDIALEQGGKRTTAKVLTTPAAPEQGQHRSRNLGPKGKPDLKALKPTRHVVRQIAEIGRHRARLVHDLHGGEASPMGILTREFDEPRSEHEAQQEPAHGEDRHRPRW